MMILIALCSFALSTSSFAYQGCDNMSSFVVGEREESLQVQQQEGLLRDSLIKEAFVLDRKERIQKNTSKAISKTASFTTHPGAYHNVVSVSPQGNFELEDGSFWLISPTDAITTLGWQLSDQLIITVNQSWYASFSSYKFKVSNQTSGESILANLDLGPRYNGPHTRSIAAIDYYYNVIYLNDTTVWHMSSFDSRTVSKWLVGDTVIIGVNDSWFSFNNPNILINANMINYAAGATTY